MAGKAYDYDVVLSFAAEDRSLVARLAAMLERAEVRVLCDEIEKPRKGDKDLARHLARYRRKAPLCAVFASRHYASQRWTKAELARERKSRDDLAWVKPVQLDDTDLPGLPPSDEPIRLTRRNLTQVAGQLLSGIKGQTYADFELDSLTWDGRRVRYQGAEMVSYWPKHIRRAQKTATLGVINVMTRIKYGDEADDWGAERQACHDCRVIKGQYHVPGCDVEQCPSCGGQLISCVCEIDGWGHLR